LQRSVFSGGDGILLQRGKGDGTGLEDPFGRTLTSSAVAGEARSAEAITNAVERLMLVSFHRKFTRSGTLAAGAPS
jgi:hypothetical protein